MPSGLVHVGPITRANSPAQLRYRAWFSRVLEQVRNWGHNSWTSMWSWIAYWARDIHMVEG